MVDSAQRPYHSFQPSEPWNPKDTPRFSQLNETAKDVFIAELKRFFDYTTSDGLQKIIEIPTIQKFAMGSSTGDIGLETVVNTIITYGDTMDKYPMIAITSSTQRERKMGIGSNFVAQVQAPSGVKGRNTGPWRLTDLPDDMTIIIETTPKGVTQRSTLLFRKSLFNGTDTLFVEDIIRVINKTQALYYTLSSDVSGKLIISAGGLAAPVERNTIAIVGGSDILLNLLGFQVGDSSSFLDADKPLKNRYVSAADMVINIDVISDDLNTRIELSDIVSTYFSYYTQNRVYQYLGRSYFDNDLDPPEWFRIALNHQFSWSGEISKPRYGGDRYEHVHAIRGSIPIFIEDFIDKTVTASPVWLDRSNVSESQGVFGDYGGTNYLK